MLRRSTCALASMLTALAVGQGAAAATVWNESVNGDLSGSYLAPTPVTLSLGTNSIIGSVTAGDRDYFRIAVPNGATFTQMILGAYSVSPANLMFAAIESGTIITEPPTSPNPANLLGYAHVGYAQLGTDVLDDMAASNLSDPPAMGFTTPLPAGDYSFWLQQLNATPTSYRFDLVIVPEPAAAPLLAFGLVALAILRRHRA